MGSPTPRDGLGRMRYVSLFSGIEAASAAWGPLGWEPVAFSEIDPFACAVLAERFPGVPNLGDVTEVDWSGYAGSIDLIVGGSPCQAFSVAGKREGLMDSRGQLMLEYVRAVREIRPRWVLWENVPGVLSQDKGEAFATLQDELEQCGYSLAWRVLDAQFFVVAQRRRRVFLVGHSDPGCAAAVLFERESLRWDYPSSRKKREKLAGPVDHVARCGREARPTWSILGNVCDRDARQNGNGVSEDVAPTLNTVDRHAVVYEESGCLNPWDCQSNRVFGVNGPFQTLYAHGGSGRHNCAVLVDTMASTHANAGIGEDTGTCLTAHSEKDAPVLNVGTSVRRLMPVECERLQGFPDGWTAIPWRGKPAEECPDTPRYRAIGNSMAVHVMTWIGERIAMADEVGDGLWPST